MYLEHLVGLDKEWRGLSLGERHYQILCIIIDNREFQTSDKAGRMGRGLNTNFVYLDKVLRRSVN